ncbi:MAG: hypothetical protein Q9O62_08720 [Ardenticatenia bacterium]|nr:hypothetical protein [Ardenticatenia bacterium]
MVADGYALVVLSSDGDVDGFLQAFRGHGFAVQAVAEQDWGNEVVWLYKLHARGGE